MLISLNVPMHDVLSTSASGERKLEIAIEVACEDAGANCITSRETRPRPRPIDLVVNEGSEISIYLLGGGVTLTTFSIGRRTRHR